MSNYNCWCDNDEIWRLTTMLTAHTCLLHAMNFYYCCFFKIGRKNIGLEMTNSFKIKDRLLKELYLCKYLIQVVISGANQWICLLRFMNTKQNSEFNFLFEATNYLMHFIYFCSHEIVILSKIVILSTYSSFYNTKVVVKFVNVPN